jgi:hypothetical protein
MEAFDQNVVSGLAGSGDLQNGKGDFFNDLLALLLENRAGVSLYSRGHVPGLVFPKNHLDITYPATGPVEFMLEAKALGTPRHSLSQRAKALGREGSADLDKRIKEIGFKTIDLKAEFSRITASATATPSSLGGDLTAWLKSVKPKSYVFFSARVISDKDRDRVIRLSSYAAELSDGVGLFCFRPVSVTSSAYVPVEVPAQLQIARVLFRASQELIANRERTDRTP